MMSVHVHLYVPKGRLPKLPYAHQTMLLVDRCTLHGITISFDLLYTWRALYSPQYGHASMSLWRSSNNGIHREVRVFSCFAQTQVNNSALHFLWNFTSDKECEVWRVCLFEWERGRAGTCTAAWIHPSSGFWWSGWSKYQPRIVLARWLPCSLWGWGRARQHY